MDRGDSHRWIDAPTMIADRLTKTMKADRLLQCMSTGFLDLRPTEDSLAIKEKNRVARAEKRGQEKALKEKKSQAYLKAVSKSKRTKEGSRKVEVMPTIQEELTSDPESA